MTGSDSDAGDDGPGGATRPVRVACCQLDLHVGDLTGNVGRMAAAYHRADAAGADLVVFSELAICGYPPEDLLLKPGFVAATQDAVERLAAEADGAAVAVVGWVDGRRRPGADPHDPTDGPWNAAAVLHGGRVVASTHKQALPNYGVFDEHRYFDPGRGGQPLIEVAGALTAVTVCEDLWVDDGPVHRAVEAGADLVVNINASPFHRGKQAVRTRLLADRSAQVRRPIVYVNCVGGQDELVFDGGSVVVGADSSVLARAPRFAEAEVVIDVPVPVPTGNARGSAAVEVVAVTRSPRRDGPSLPPAPAAPAEGEPGPHDVAEVWDALALGTRDYVTKNGFTDVVVGLSGGIDSALVAAIAADALGPDRVHAVLMPSRYSSEHSVTDAVRLSENLGIEHRTIPIEPAHAALWGSLEPSLRGREVGLTEENLQSRIRGVILMALSNAAGWMVLTTGNKSETAVGYSTLYGDTAGGLAVIKDVPKLLVYELCRWRNEREGRDVVPTSILTKAPSAELRPDQRDDQSLPPYEILDPLIDAYVDGDLTPGDLVDIGHDAGTVARVASLIDGAEYKRRQSPPGIRISEKAFGRDRRIPITNAFRGR